MYDHLLALRKAMSGYDVSAASGQTLQQTPKVLGSAKIMRNQVTEPIVAYLLLLYLPELHFRFINSFIQSSLLRSLYTGVFLPRKHLF